MTITDNLLLWSCIIWLPWLMYVLLRNEAKPKKNIIIGATLPYSARQDADVQALQAKYKKQVLQISVLMTLLGIPCIFVKSFGVSLTLWLIWVAVVCVIYILPYARCNSELRRLKAEKGWKQPGGAQAVVDLKAVTPELKHISPLWFLPPVLISLLPIAFEPDLWPLWITDAALIVLFWLCCRYCYRRRSEMVDNDTQRTIALTRIRQSNWARAWVIMAWSTGLLNVGIWLTLDHAWGMMGVMLTYSAVVVAVMLIIEFRVRRLQESLCSGSGQGFYLDEDDYWIWGMFYYNPHDSRLIVNNRVGINTTFNLAKRAAQVIAGFLILILLACPLVGVWITEMEKAPVEITVTESTVEASHFGSKYTVPLEDIKSVSLLDELPGIRRISGTGMPSASTGIWTSSEWGRFTCCIDPREGPWLLLETHDGSICLFGGAGASEEAFRHIS